MERLTLLLVDPDPRSTRVLEVALRKAGYAVKVANTAEEALALAHAQLPAMVLAETVLPTPEGAPSRAMDGFELCQKLKALPGAEALPFLFLTSSSTVEDKVRGLRLGVEDYLTKPIYIKELLTRVQLVFARHQRAGLQAGTARQGFNGDLADMGLVDLLTTLDLGRKTGTLALHGAYGKGEARFRDGRVLDARTGSLRGERALYRMLRWTEGRFEVHFGAVEGEQTLEASTQVLLLEGLRRVDEWQHLLESLPSLTLVFEPVARQSQEVPVEADVIVGHLDGTRSALEALEASGLDDLDALARFSRLFHLGLVQPRRLSLGLGEGLPEILSGDAEPAALSPTELQVPSDQPPPPEEELERVVDGMTAAFRSNHKTVEASQEGQDPPPRGGQEPADPAQEQDVAKHRGKRGRTKRESMAPGVATATSAAIHVEEPLAQSDPPTSLVAPRSEALSAPPDKTVRVEGNLIHFPKLTPEPAEAPPAPPRVGQVTLPAGSMAPEEAGRDSAPPAEPSPQATVAPPGVLPSEPAPTFSEAKGASGEGETAAVSVEAKGPEGEKAAAPVVKIPTDEKAVERPRLADERKDSVNRKREDSKRDRKESLSTHLSDEARAFFSDDAFEKAYKAEHDSFEDLHPTPQHPREAAHSRRWMTLTGTLLFGIIAILAGGYIYTRTVVPETVVDTHRIHVSEHIPPPGDPMPPAVTTPVGSAPNTGASASTTSTPEATPTAPTATAPTANTVTDPAATPSTLTEPPGTASAATAPGVSPAPAAGTDPTATVPAAATPPATATQPAAVPSPTGQTPAQLLAAARAFRGPLAGRLAAYNAYFDAAPTDTRTMLVLAMQLAESSRFAEAEAIATRVTAAQPTSGQGWFLLAFARKHQNNREGTAEARRRCTALGGQWANECRAL